MPNPASGSRLRALCVSPAHTRSFSSFGHAFSLFPTVKAMMPPLGILTIAARLPPAWEVRFIDENVRPVRDDDLRWADVVLATGMHNQEPLLHALSARAHRHGKLIALGGPSVSAAPERYADFDILHMGELGDATDALIARLERSIERPVQQEVFVTRERLDLDACPIPAYHLIDTRDYMMMSVQWSSGCPYTCEFCDIPVLYGRKPRYKSPERLIAELSAIAARDSLGVVFFVDDNLIADKKALRGMLPRLIEWQRLNGHRLRFLGECTLNVATDRGILSMLREANFTDMYFGIESPDPDALVLLDKEQNIRMPLLDAVRAINAHGIGVHAGFILGLDTDSDKTVDDIVAFLDRSQIAIAVVNLLYAPPKTPLYERLSAEGRLIPHDEVEDSNVRFKDPTSVVMQRWRRLVEHAYAPTRIFERLRYQARHTYPNGLTLSLSRYKLSPGMALNGVGAILSIFVRMGLLAPYRRAFLSLAVELLLSGKIELLVHAGAMGYHFIRFRDEALEGRVHASLHTELGGAGVKDMPKKTASGASKGGPGGRIKLRRKPEPARGQA